MQTWEYKFYVVTDERLCGEGSLSQPEPILEGGAIEADVNRLADEGWELMPCVASLASLERQLLIFRRPKDS